MKHSFSVTLRPCGSCVSHSHCKDCCSRIEEDLTEKAPIQKAELDPMKKLLVIESDLSADAMEDFLDDMGIYVL